MIRDLVITVTYPNVTQEQIDQWFAAYEFKYKVKLTEKEKEIFLSGEKIRILLEQEPPFERGHAVHQLISAPSFLAAVSGK